MFLRRDNKEIIILKHFQMRYIVKRILILSFLKVEFWLCDKNNPQMTSIFQILTIYGLPRHLHNITKKRKIDYLIFYCFLRKKPVFFCSYFRTSFFVIFDEKKLFYHYIIIIK
ncbi:hypothetical protein EDEG_03516 [Edhazardia aedis USNM 41457]|uniref:Uncharacterized protein n=1 Tax=Edhazardia aedis (strain USNM 41457) TaxID=1003232 RepID=J9DKX6_EDHAE|nr:hypothetical protein EDEG_03516 [Edhazardia aedis USNM 41457]|eukprot:EJW02032.1 hypothetical protein EDEG_03516 [Edhazardia aedis USNM 41457]